MRKLNLFLVCSILAVMFLVAGCNDKNEPENPVLSFIELDRDTLSFNPGSGSQTITISSNENWTASNTAGWLTVSPQSGTGNTTVIISILENELPEEREAILVFNSETQTATAIITQAAASPFIQLDRNTLNFGRDGGSQNITVSSNDSWTISGGVDWLTISHQSGEGNATISVTASQNEITETRSATLTFTRGTETATVTIIQEAALPFIELNRNTLNFNSTGGNQTVTVSSNGNWTVSGTTNWLTVSPQSGTGNTTVTITVTANTTYQIRTSTLIFRNGTQTATVDITQEANIYQGVVINGVRWATRNVDAPGTFAATPESSGMFYQWNRRRGWGTTPTVSGWDSSIPTGNSWTRANDPCPTGWRIPTEGELRTLLQSTRVTAQMRTTGTRGMLFTDRTTGNTLFLPAAGWRHREDGWLESENWVGEYWSSTVAESNEVWTLVFNISNRQYWVDWGNRTFGKSVRCVAE